jgi:hypothetical protein
MKRFGIAICVVLAFATVGCKKGKGGGADPKNMTVDQACDKVVAMMDDMGKAVSAAGEDCNKMGDALEKWAADNKAFIDWGKEQDKDPAKKKEFDDKCKSKMEGAMEKMGPMMGGLMKCGDNAKVKAAMESMGK